MRIGLVASARFPIREPFTGGLEAQTWALASGLRRNGHEVTVFAAPGSDPVLGVHELEVQSAVLSTAARADVSMGPEHWLQDHHAYLALMLDLADRTDLDVVHNNSLHYLPIAMAATLPIPVITTLHTPPTPWLESAVQAPRGCPVTFVAVSRHTAQAWRHLVPSVTIPNGVDTDRWRLGAGGGPLVWSGRLVPEKAPHLAAEAASRAGMPLQLAGPVLDQHYFDSMVRPWLGRDIDYVGHLCTDDLVTLVGAASATLATPCWDEPYGLVVAESMACGTPVAGFARGALPDLIGPRHGRLVAAGDAGALARVLPEVVDLDRSSIRRFAERTCSVDAMVDSYTRLYDSLASGRAA
ncbi:MAG: glycosyl transferase family 1 [Frankiales bacterium]|nr:glycosyl transferase family 1 [Frankiales bacterium]